MRNKIGNVLWGLFFVILGVGFAGNAFDLWNFNLFFPGWWTLFIIIPCGISIFQNGFQVAPVCGLIIGLLLFLGQNSVLDMSIIGRLIFPIILILIGISIMFRRSFQGRYSGGFSGGGNGADMGKHTGSKEGMLDYSAVFSGQKIAYNNEVFTGASLNAVFGGIEIDLMGAIINEDVVIDCSAIFGGIDMFVPRDVNIKVSSTPIFGGVDNKRRNNPVIQGAPTIFINATSMFGGVDIK